MSTNIRTLQPVLRVGQRTDPSREFSLVDSEKGAEPIDLTNATRVTLTMEHYTRAFTAVDSGRCTIVDPEQGVVEYDFDASETSLYGRYYVQFEVRWQDQSRSMVPPSGYEWVLDIGRRQPDDSPLEVPRVYADEAVIDDLEAEQARLHSLVGLEVPAGDALTDLFGRNLYYERGKLNAFDPDGTGEVFDHDHTSAGGDGGTIGEADNPAAPAHIQEVYTDRLQDGSNPAETISGTGSSLQFTANEDRDIHDETDVTLTNGTSGDITEDVTVDYYEGVDATGTLIASETQTATVAAGASSAVTFLTGDFGLGLGDYYIEVTTSNLTGDGIDEHTLGAEFVTEQDGEGDLVTTDQQGRERARLDSTSETTSFPDVEINGDTLPDSTELPVAAFTYAGVTWWIGTEETAEMADTDVFIDIS